MAMNWTKIGYTSISKSERNLVVAIDIKEFEKLPIKNGKRYGLVALKDLNFALGNPERWCDIIAGTEQ